VRARLPQGLRQWLAFKLARDTGEFNPRTTYMEVPTLISPNDLIHLHFLVCIQRPLVNEHTLPNAPAVGCAGAPAARPCGICAVPPDTTL